MSNGGCVFLGWDRPMFSLALDWLAQRRPMGADCAWDLEGLVVVLPTAEAGRRFLERLTEASPAGVLGPAIRTPGGLAELLFEPARPVADALTARLVRLAGLREADPTELVKVLPQPPEPEDWSGWWSLAGQLERLSHELAGGLWRLEHLAERINSGELDVPGAERWLALAGLEAAYHTRLEAAGLIDAQRARLEAIEAGACGYQGGQIVLVGVSDPGRLVTAMLEQVSCPVHALVHAPAEHGAGFDRFGALRVDYWSAQRLEIPDGVIRFADRPWDQAREVAAALQAEASNRYGADQITVGLGDESHAGVHRRALELVGLPTRYGAGRPAGRSRPALLLEAMAGYLESRRFDDFARLLRHPDMEAALRRDLGERGEATHRAWLTLLDEYVRDHLQGRVDGRWLDDAGRRSDLRALYRAVEALLPGSGDERQAWGAWSEPLLAALRAVYGDQELARHDPEQAGLVRALELVAELLREQARLGADETTTPRLSVAEAIRLTLARLGEAKLPELGGRDAIELMGFLELRLDDAPLLVLAGLNERAVPEARHGDAFLPDALRSRLGLPDNAHRYARDLLALGALLGSRQRLVLIAGRRSGEGEPLAPSRLLLACDDAALVRRIRAFYEQDGGARPAERRLIDPGEEDRFLIPPPVLPEQPLRRLRVTAFRDYLACPYRFYLRHVRRLEGLDDRVSEMDAAVFGTLAHAVLAQFGRSDAAASDDPQTIEAYLSAALDEAAREQFGRTWRPAVRLQVEQLRYRLRGFAVAQASLAREGWRILADRVEFDGQATIQTDGEPFVITGRVDRVDWHPDLGYRVLDYKTGDSGGRPEQQHQKRDPQGAKVWVDLQLPLYLDLLALDAQAEPVSLGYFNLPKKVEEVGPVLAGWDEAELAEARAMRDMVVERIVAGVFWPPSDQPPTYADAFTRVCADEALGRERLIERSGQQARRRGGV